MSKERRARRTSSRQRRGRGQKRHQSKPNRSSRRALRCQRGSEVRAAHLLGKGAGAGGGGHAGARHGAVPAACARVRKRGADAPLRRRSKRIALETQQEVGIISRCDAAKVASAHDAPEAWRREGVERGLQPGNVGEDGGPVHLIVHQGLGHVARARALVPPVVLGRPCVHMGSGLRP